MTYKLIALLLLAFISTSTAFIQGINHGQPITYHEEFRPGYHFSCPKNWMNDPNGLVYHNGVYHMYYQYNPYGLINQHLSWGHAISTDLVYWKNLPVAITEYGIVQIYSGSVVTDVNNTSGYCVSEKLGCLLAYYTAQSPNNESQAMAYSNDFGLTYTEYPKNPVIDLNLTQWRDPKVFWYEPEQKWVMITALSDRFMCRLLASTDMINWTQLSDFGPSGDLELPWEDPDLFPLIIEGTSTQVWVLTHSVAVNKVEYYIGDFDGTTFTETYTLGTNLFIDYGRDFDEAASWNEEPKGRRLMVAWLDEAEYAIQLPEKGWLGQFTLIRDLKARQYPEGLRIVQGPIEELTKLRYDPIHLENIELDSPILTLNVTGNQLEILAEFDFSNTPFLDYVEFGFNVFVGPDQVTSVGYNVNDALLVVNRTNSGIVSFNGDFGGVKSFTLKPENKTLQLHIFTDQSSVEVFADNGKVAMAHLIFPDPTQNQVQIYLKGRNVTVTSLDIWQLKGIWPDDYEEQEATTKEDFLSKVKEIFI